MLARARPPAKTPLLPVSNFAIHRQVSATAEVPVLGERCSCVPTTAHRNVEDLRKCLGALRTRELLKELLDNPALREKHLGLQT